MIQNELEIPVVKGGVPLKNSDILRSMKYAIIESNSNDSTISENNTTESTTTESISIEITVEKTF